jgi:hypothetical protein
MQQGLGIASNILADRLRALIANGLFDRRLYQVAPDRYDYWMTTMGRISIRWRSHCSTGLTAGCRQQTSVIVEHRPAARCWSRS